MIKAEELKNLTEDQNWERATRLSIEKGLLDQQFIGGQCTRVCIFDELSTKAQRLSPRCESILEELLRAGYKFNGKPVITSISVSVQVSW